MADPWQRLPGADYGEWLLAQPGRICAVKNLNSGVMTQYIYDG
jgi:hypothetical protein